MTGISDPKCLFGVHSVTAYDPDTGIPFGIAKVVKAQGLSNTGETIDLTGGSSAYPWKIEQGAITAEGTFTIAELPTWAFEAFMGKAATVNAAETGGSVDTISNQSGVSAFDAVTGIASVGVETGEEANVKSLRYVVKVVSATTVDVYAYSDVDFATGDDLIFQDDTLKITASPLTIAMGASVSIPNTGLELVGGSGTIALVDDDTAIFASRAINDGSTQVVIGSDTSNYIDVGIILHGQKLKDGTVVSLDIFRAMGIGVPLNFAEKGFSELEFTWKAQYDSTKNGVFQYLRVNNT